VAGGFAIADTAANIESGLASLAADPHITAIDLMFTETVAEFTADRAALDKLAGGFAISDTAANVQAALASLAADPYITSITATGGTLTETIAEFTADKSALDKVTAGFAISDTQANVQAGMAGLSADPHVASIEASEPDGAYQVTYLDVASLGYSSYADIYNSSGAFVADAQDLANGAGNLILHGDDLVVSASSGQQSVTTGSDTFAINPHAAETIAASGVTGETFEFASGFGQNAITGFLATGATHDVIEFNRSMFSSLTPTMTQAQEVAALLAGAAQNGANLVITDSTADVLTLNGITKAALSANPSDFRFT
jgi:hypothetical protein